MTAPNSRPQPASPAGPAIWAGRASPGGPSPSDFEQLRHFYQMVGLRSALPWVLADDVLYFPSEDPKILSVFNQFMPSGLPFVLTDGSEPVWDHTPFLAIHLDSTGRSTMLLTRWASNPEDVHMLGAGETQAALCQNLPVVTQELCSMDRHLLYDLCQAGRLGGVLGRRSFLTCDTRDMIFSDQGLGGGIPGLDGGRLPRENFFSTGPPRDFSPPARATGTGSNKSRLAGELRRHQVLGRGPGLGGGTRRSEAASSSTGKAPGQTHFARLAALGGSEEAADSSRRVGPEAETPRAKRPRSSQTRK